MAPFHIYLEADYQVLECSAMFLIPTTVIYPVLRML